MIKKLGACECGANNYWLGQNEYLDSYVKITDNIACCYRCKKTLIIERQVLNRMTGTLTYL
jgi:hypothetical protein